MILLDIGIAAAIGGLVGAGELVARYRDAPASALRTRPALFYVLTNGLASALALGASHTFDWRFGFDAEGVRLRWLQIAIAGFGAMAVFRSSLFTTRVGDQDVGVGPSAFLSVILIAADRAVDRVRASARAPAVAKIMDGVVFDNAVEALPVYCFALMQNLSADEQEVFGRQVRALRDSGMRDRAKSLALGLALVDLVGEPVLRAAVETLSNDIKVAVAGPPA